MISNKKIFRILILFDRIQRNVAFTGESAASEFEVSTKTIERDIKELNDYLKYILKSDAKIRITEKVEWTLTDEFESKLSKEETLALIKVMLESRAFSKDDLTLIFDKLMNYLSREDKKLLQKFYGNEKEHYMQTKNSKSLFKILWDFSLAVNEKRIISASYKRNIDGLIKDIEIEPIGIMFSEYYFYVLAYPYNEECANPIAFRIDNFQNYEITDIRFTRNPSYKDRFEEGQFRKRVQFMSIGELLTVEFEFWGRSLDAVTDRLPTARIVEKKDGRTVLRAEIYGRGLKMWFLSQGEFLKVTHPPEFVQEMKTTIANMMENYQA